jgi:hypothetical protein
MVQSRNKGKPSNVKKTVVGDRYGVVPPDPVKKKKPQTRLALVVLIGDVMTGGTGERMDRFCSAIYRTVVKKTKRSTTRVFMVEGDSVDNSYELAVNGAKWLTNKGIFSSVLQCHTGVRNNTIFPKKLIEAHRIKLAYATKEIEDQGWATDIHVVDFDDPKIG